MYVPVAEIHCKVGFTIKHRTIHLKDAPLELRVTFTMTYLESCDYRCDCSSTSRVMT